MDAGEKIEMVLEWADEQGRGFDTEFIESLDNYYSAMGYLTQKQMDALDNIIAKWRIE